MSKKSGQIVQTERLRDQVYTILRDEITSGYISAGDRLIEVELAQRLGVSRTPVREALFQLARDGLLVENHRGYVLPHHTPEAIKNWLEIRALIEPVIVRRACSEASPKQINGLLKALEMEQKNILNEKPAKYIQAHRRFREVLWSMCKNPLLGKHAKLYDDFFQSARIGVFENVNNRKGVTKFHKKIYEAIKNKHPDAAEEAITGIHTMARQHLELADDEAIPHRIREKV